MFPKKQKKRSGTIWEKALALYTGVFFFESKMQTTESVEGFTQLWKMLLGKVGEP